MRVLSKKDILSKDDCVKERVEIPEWDGVVFVRLMDGFSREEFAEFYNLKKKDKNAYNRHDVSVRLAALTICDEKGERLFSAEDVEELGKKSGAALERVVAVSMRLNGLLSEAQFKEEVKN